MPKTEVRYVTFYPSEHLADLMQMSTEAAGAYSRLYFSLFQQGGSLPNDLDQLAAIAGTMTLDFQQRIWPVLRSKFIIRNGKLYHPRVSSAINKAKQYQQNQRKAGLMSGQVRKRRSSDVRTPLQTPVPKKTNAVRTILSEGINKDISSRNITIHSGKIQNDLNLLLKTMRSLQPSEKDAAILASIAHHIKNQCPDRLKDAVEWVRIALTKKGKPMAYFITIAKNETGWAPSKGSVGLGQTISVIGIKQRE
jgi:uncharacterized protein YdaU (DUF1376 family)